MIDPKDLENRFTFHPALDGRTAGLHEAVRSECLAMSFKLNSYLPDSREKVLAITRLEEVMMWANAAIARAVPLANPELEDSLD